MAGESMTKVCSDRGPRDQIPVLTFLQIYCMGQEDVAVLIGQIWQRVVDHYTSTGALCLRTKLEL